jgi:hypothetical protein
MTGRRIVALASVCGAFAFAAQGAVAGEITGTGKPLWTNTDQWGVPHTLHANSPCAFSGQEDTQFPANPDYDADAGHSQNWGHWPDRANTPNPGTSCNGHLSGMK